MSADPWSESVDEGGSTPIQPARYLESVRRHWLLVVSVVALAVLAAVLYVGTAQKRYAAHAQIVVTPLPVDNTTFLGIGGLIRDSTASQPVVTAAELLNAPQVRQQTVDRLHPRGSVSFGVTPLGQSNVVDIQATASTPRRAQRAANAYAETALDLRKAALQTELASAISRLQGRLAVAGKNGANAALNAQITQQLAQLNSLVGSPDPTLALLNRAAEPSSYSWPRPKLSYLIALLCGLVLGAIAAVIVDYFDPAAKDPAELREAGGPPTLVWAPDISARDLRRYVNGELPRESELRDAFRRLRGVLMGPRATEPPPPVVAVCSNDDDEGRTTTAVGLAKAIADVDRRVVLVDGDLRRATATSLLLGAPAGASLADVLRSPASLPNALVSLAPNLWFVPAVTDRDGPDLLASERLDDLLEPLREDFDSIVVDAAAFDHGLEGYAFAEVTPTVLVCARLGHTSRWSFGDNLRRLRDLGVVPAGVVAVGDASAGRKARARWTFPEGVGGSDRRARVEELARSLVSSRRARDGSPGYE